MLDLTQYDCLGAALRDALDRWPNETCLIEADRDKEKARLTYRQFKEAALPLARALQDSGFSVEGRADGGILCEVEHYRRDWMRSARVLKSLTPWTS